MAQTTSDWILPLDDDDTLDPGAIEALVGASQGSDFVYGWNRMTGRTDHWVTNRLFAEHSLYRQPYIPITALIRRSLFETIGGFLNVQMEDWNFQIRAVQHGARFRCVPEVIWSYRHHPGQNYQRQAA